MRSGVTNAATTTAALLLLAMAVCDMQRVKAADPFDGSEVSLQRQVEHLEIRRLLKEVKVGQAGAGHA